MQQIYCPQMTFKCSFVQVQIEERSLFDLEVYGRYKNDQWPQFRPRKSPGLSGLFIFSWGELGF